MDRYGLKNDISARYQKDANGNLARGANGLPIRLPSLDAVTAARMQFIERGAHAKRNYDQIYPSANVVFNLTQSLLLHASYAETITRPNLDQIIPGMTITDPNTTNDLLAWSRLVVSVCRLPPALTFHATWLP